MDVKQPAQVQKRESGEEDENEFASVEEEAFTMVSPSPRGGAFLMSEVLLYLESFRYSSLAEQREQLKTFQRFSDDGQGQNLAVT